MIQLVTVASVLQSVRPAPSINTGDDSVIDLWAQRLNVPRATLLAAISEVGSSIAAVRRHLSAKAL